MRLVKVLGPLLVAAFVLVALLGSASASAAIHTTLCSVAAEECPAANQEAPQALEATSSGVTIHTNVGAVNCGGSTLKGETTATEGTPLPLKLSALSLSGCNFETGTKCEVAEKHAPSGGSIAWTTGETGALEVAGGASGWKESVKCGVFINCEYAGPISLKASHGALTASEVPLVAVGGGTCPKTSSLVASYSVSKPNPFNVSYAHSVGTSVICKTGANAPFCVEGNQYTAGTPFKAETAKLSIQTSLASAVICESSLRGNIGATGPTGEVPIGSASWSIGACGLGELSGGGCSVSTNGISQWNVFWERPPRGSNPEEPGSAYGNHSESFGITCGTFLQASYIWENPRATIVNGSPGEVEVFGILKCLGGNICKEGAGLVGHFTTTSPGPFYLTHT